MNIKNYSYNDKTQLTKNINVSELKCKCGGTHDIKIDVDHINKIQEFMNTYGYNKVIISSGYRCSIHDKNVGGSGSGQHTKGTATDLRFYKDDKTVSAKEVCCKAQDFGFKGIGYIDPNYVHLDSRTSGTYRGDETKNMNNNVGNDFYSYFGIKNDNPKPTNNASSIVQTIQKGYNSKWGSTLGRIAEDNIFGNDTKKHLIMALQQELNVQFGAGLNRDGVFGNLTKNAFRTVKKGARGNITWLCQAMLYIKGYDPNGLDGIFGDGMYKCIRQYQTDKKLGVDGLLGKNTAYNLFN